MAEVDQLPPEAPALPTVVLGGWLGAGKTTLLNRWLREAGGLRLAVLVNDFGEISIDADLIVGADGDVISLAGGCICCAVGSDLFGALRRMTERRPRPDVLLVETSGVALPAAVARTVRLVPDIEVRAVVVLVDAPAWPEQVRDRYVADTVRQQVSEADLLVLTKLQAPHSGDNAADEGGREDVRGGAHEGVSVRQALASIAPRTPVLDAGADADVLRRAVFDHEGQAIPVPAGSDESMAHGRIGDEPVAADPAPVQPRPRVGLDQPSQPRQGALQPVGASLAPAASRFESRLETFDHPVDPQALLAGWAAEGAAVVRAKGWVTGLDGRRWRIQVVGRRGHAAPDDHAPPGDRVVVIRRRADPSAGG